MKNVMKYGSLAMAALGVLLMIYALMDKHPLSLGQSLLTVGALFAVGGLLLSQLEKATETLDYIAHTTNMMNKRDGDEARERVLAVSPPTLPFPPKTTPVVSVISEVTPSNEMPTIVPTIAVTAAATAAVAAIATPTADKPHEYFNDIAKYLTPKEEPIIASPVEVETAKAEISDPKESEIPDIIAAPLKIEMKDNNDWLSRNQVSLNRIATDFPELDALLKKEAAAVQVDEPVMEPVSERVEAPAVENTPPAPSIIREGQISGIGFRLFSDGTIEADFVNGRHRFASISEFKSYVEGA